MVTTLTIQYSLTIQLITLVHNYIQQGKISFQTIIEGKKILKMFLKGFFYKGSQQIKITSIILFINKFVCIFN